MRKKTDKSDSAAFEKSLKRLEEVVEQLDEGEVSLDQAIKLYEEGKRLGKQCLKQLSEIEQRVLKIVDAPEGETRVEPFEAPAEESP